MDFKLGRSNSSSDFCFPPEDEVAHWFPAALVCELSPEEMRVAAVSVWFDRAWRKTSHQSSNSSLDEHKNQ